MVGEGDSCVMSRLQDAKEFEELDAGGACVED